jgi:hypothetical protein
MEALFHVFFIPVLEGVEFYGPVDLSLGMEPQLNLNRLFGRP